MAINANVVFSHSTLNVNAGATVDVHGSLSIASSTLNITGGTLQTESDGSLNLSSDSTVDPTSGGTIVSGGALSVDGNSLTTLATGSSSTQNGSLYYSFQLARLYQGSEPLRLSEWDINWGDGSTIETFPVTNTTPTIVAGHYYSSAYTHPVVQITATTAAVGNIAALTLQLPPSTISGNPPPPVSLAATASAANSVDLTWNYDTNLNSDFLLHVSGSGFSQNDTIPAGTFEDQVTGLPADEQLTFTLTAHRSDGTTSAAATVQAIAPAVTVSATGPTSMAEGTTSGALTLTTSTPTNINAWHIQWTDQNGVAITSSWVYGTGNRLRPAVVPATSNINYPTVPTGTQMLVANITAYDTSGWSFTLPAYDVVVAGIAPITLASTADFPMSSLPTVTPVGTAISAWQVNWGNGQSLILFPGDDVANPYPDAAASYQAVFTALDANLNPEYEYTDVIVDVTVSPPSIPTGLTVTQTDSNVTLNWISDLIDVSSFNVYASANNGGTYSLVDSVDSSQTSDTLTGLAPNTPYLFEVTAVNSHGESAASVSGAITTPDIPTQPSGLGISGYSSDEIDLAWTNNATTPANIDILMSTDGTTFNLFDSVPNTQSTYVAKGLQSGTTYYFELQTTAGSVSAIASGVVSQATGSLASPTGLVASSASPNEIDLVWDFYPAPFATEINIYESTDGTTFNYIGSADATSTWYHTLNLVPGTNYTFQITASDAANNGSAPSSNAYAATAADPWHIQASGPTTANEGIYTLNLSSGSTSGSPSFYDWVVEWGDGLSDTYYTPNATVTHNYAGGSGTHTIQVSANTAFLAPISLTVTAPPIAVGLVPLPPTGLVATVASSTEMDLTWVNNSLMTAEIEVLRSLNGGAFSLIETLDPGTTTYADTNLVANEGVQYEVAAIDEGTAEGDLLSTVSTSASLTTPTGVPVLTSATQSEHNSPSVVLIWTYKGNDASGFEVEMRDQSSGNFHTVNPDSTQSTTDPATGITTTSVTVSSGIVGGGSYAFRVRADHTDGTASDYTTTKAVTIAQAAAPTVDVTTVSDDYGKYLRVGWSGLGANAGVILEVKSDALPGSNWWAISFSEDVHSAWPGDFHGDEYGWDDNQFATTTDQGYVLMPEVFGPGKYQYRIQSDDQWGNATAWSTPASGTVTSDFYFDQPAPGPAPKLGLSTSGTDITATWKEPVSGPGYNGPVVTGYTLLQYPDGGSGSVGVGEDLPVAWMYYLSHTSDSDFKYYTNLMPDNTPGQTYDFVLWTNFANDDYDVFSGGSIKVGGSLSGGAPPQAPASLHAAYDPSVPRGQVKLYWPNTSDNETGFVIEEYDPHRLASDNDDEPGTKWVVIGSTGPDTTSFVDSKLSDTGFFSDNGPYQFRVKAIGAGGSSDWVQASASAIGGPDVTQRLLAISKELARQYTIMLTDLGGVATAFLMSEVWLRNPNGNWDINPLHLNKEFTSANSGVLPSGASTVTAGGEVFNDFEVNYWLFGAWASEIGIPLGVAEAEALTWKTRYLLTSDGAAYANTARWIEDGYDGVFSYTSGHGMQGVQPATPPPAGEEGLPMWWYVGNPIAYEGTN